MPADMIVAAHGNFDRCSCIETGEEVDVEEVRAAIAHGKEGEEGWQAMAERHGGLVKPDIVFFGEALPERFFDLARSDFEVCDLLIILGTSLKVHPFASLVGLVAADVPRLLINREVVGTQGQPLLEMLGFIDPKALDFDEHSRYRDALFLGDTDKAVHQLAMCLDAASAAASCSPEQEAKSSTATSAATSAASAASAITSSASATSVEPPTEGELPTSADDATPSPSESWVAALQRRIDSQPPPPSKPPLWVSACSSSSAHTSAEPEPEPDAAEPAAATLPTAAEVKGAVLLPSMGMEAGEGEAGEGAAGDQVAESGKGGESGRGDLGGGSAGGGDAAEEHARTCPCPTVVVNEEPGEEFWPLEEPEPKVARLA